MHAFTNTAVEEVFSSYPKAHYAKLIELRELIYECASLHEEIGEVSESLKWGEPSFSSRHASPVRLGVFDETSVAIYFNCQTTLVENFRLLFKQELEFSKNRAIVLQIDQKLPRDILMFCIESALLYHKKK